jgi:pyruvate carboxylase subunit B
MRYSSEIHGQQTEIRLDQEVKFGVPQSAWIGDKEIVFEMLSEPSGVVIRLDSKVYRVSDVELEGSKVEFRIKGQSFSAQVLDERDQLLKKLGFSTVSTSSDGILKAPMPGKVLSILANIGDEVHQDQPLVILEAMKMENELKSPANGIIESIYIKTGDSVEKNQPILEITTRG